MFSGRVHRDNIVWLRRTFSRLSLESGSPTLAQYLDLYRDRLDENAQVKLKNLTNKLGDRLDPKHKVDLNVEWEEAGLNPNTPPCKKYLDKLCERYEEALRDVIDRILPKKQEHDVDKVKISHKGK